MGFGDDAVPVSVPETVTESEAGPEADAGSDADPDQPARRVRRTAPTA